MRRTIIAVAAAAALGMAYDDDRGYGGRARFADLSACPRIG